MSGKIRVIGGEWRGRKLKVGNAPGLRPTSDRLRETLFNWLVWQIEGSQCLDLFAGSGALGIEAASRGAKKVVLVEKNRLLAQTLIEQIAVLDTPKIQVIQTDAESFLRQPTTAFDIVFLDPPFQETLLTTCCQQLEQKNWLNANAHIYLEMAKDSTQLTLPTNWQIIRQKTIGQVTCLLAKRNTV